MRKFGRNYQLKFRIGKKIPAKSGKGVEVQWLDEITINYPLTIQFNINRSDFQDFDSCALQITNLKEDTRSKLYRDIFDMSKYIELSFYAGYGDDVTALPLIYKGEVWECYSWKPGSGTEFFTEISCLTGVIGGRYSYSNRIFEEGTKAIDVIKALCNDIGYPLLGYSEELIGKIPPLKRRTNFSGNSLECLKKFVSPNDSKAKNVIISSNAMYILDRKTAIPQKALRLSAESGLLGYPKRRDRYIDVEMLFEPEIQHCGLVELVSSVDKFFNGVWKVVALSHNGVISGAVNGVCNTKLALYTGTTSFNFSEEVKNGK